MSKPNLFRHAPSELSQDAFICWLAQWADPSFLESNPALHATGRDFLAALLAKHEHALPDPLEAVEVKPQYQGADVVVVFNGRTALLIEDKVNTKPHSNQLARYKDQLEAEFGEGSVLPIYFKTGDQSSYKRAEKNGYLFARRRPARARRRRRAGRDERHLRQLPRAPARHGCRR